MYMMKHQNLWISCCCLSLNCLQQIMQISCWKHTCYGNCLWSLFLVTNIEWEKPAAHVILYNYWLLRHWTWGDIDMRVPILTEAEPRSILVFSGRCHIMSNASIVNNCFIYIISLNKKKQQQLWTTKSWLWTMSWTVLNFFFFYISFG